MWAVVWLVWSACVWRVGEGAVSPKAWCSDWAMDDEGAAECERLLREWSMASWSSAEDGDETREDILPFVRFLWVLVSLAWITVTGLAAFLYWHSDQKIQKRLKKKNFPPFFPEVAKADPGELSELSGIKTGRPQDRFSMLSLPTFMGPAPSNLIPVSGPKSPPAASADPPPPSKAPSKTPATKK